MPSSDASTDCGANANAVKLSSDPTMNTVVPTT
jgi:hypothetical protein